MLLVDRCHIVMVFIFSLFPVVIFGNTEKTELYPSVLLTDGKVELEVFVPDDKIGYYRGCRFDWSGIAKRLEWMGYVFYLANTTKHNPVSANTLAGPAGEFGMKNPPGYDAASVGETFLKIGVGHLVKQADDGYKFHQNYKIAETPVWITESGYDWIQSHQSVSIKNGYGYEYTKRIELTKDHPGFSIEYRLKNTGKKLVDTTHYNHNFTLFNEKPLQPPLYVEFPFEIPYGEEKLIRECVRLEGNRASFKSAILPDKGYFYQHTIDQTTEAYNAGKFVDPEAGYVLSFLGDVAPFMYQYYALANTVSLEPFIRIYLEPGEEMIWSNVYSLSRL